LPTQQVVVSLCRLTQSHWNRYRVASELWSPRALPQGSVPLLVQWHCHWDRVNVGPGTRKMQLNRQNTPFESARRTGEGGTTFTVTEWYVLEGIWRKLREQEGIQWKIVHNDNLSCYIGKWY
jgi:hypothetical protein